MAKLASTLPNMVLSLSLIAMFMAGSLGFVYLKTKDPIAEAERLKKEDAVKAVIPPFESTESLRLLSEDGDSLTVTIGMTGGQPVGYAVETWSDKGFSGMIRFVVGFLPDGRISGFGGFVHKETPGLGTKMSDPKFNEQFVNKDPATFTLKVRKDGGDVDAITAATITSRAFCDGVEKAYSSYKKATEK